ncbi:MAG: HAMP domain-containing protein [Pirellulales bacterium]|nr:HAMP domain-containing protein [Pirellulales bacterium]
MNLRSVNNLMFKMALGFLLVSLVPLGIVSVFSLHAGRALLQQIVTNQLENMAVEKEQLLERWLAERKADLEVVAASAPVRSMQSEEISPYLELVQTQYRTYRRFVVVGADGQTILDSHPDGHDDWREEPWYQAGMRGERSMSDVYMAEAPDESVFRLAAPIGQTPGPPQGVVCATVTTAPIAEEVLKVSLGETGECYLVDDTGMFLAHRHPHRILKETIAQSESFANLFREKGLRPVYRDYRGIMVLGASRAIRGTGWHLVVEQDESEAFAGVRGLVRHMYVALAIIVVGVLAFSGVLAYYITAPVRALGDSAEALGNNDFEGALRCLPAPRRDEIGTLRNAFAEMAQQLRDRQSSLETRVGLTEAELQKADVRLQSTIAAAARSEQLAALGRLASGVAHEIRTPLTSLKLYLQSAQDDLSDSPEQAEDFQVASRQITRIETTINQFLSFAKPQEPVLEEVDFSSLIDEALLVVRPRANHQGVVVQTLVAPGLPRVDGDARQLGEVVVNLLVNALEEMPDGGSLRISARSCNNRIDGMTTRWVRIDVADDGPGISPANRELLFEPFFTTKASGSGLGLAIVRGTIHRHGGIIRVKTELQAGTTFSIFLPATPAHGASP